MIAPELEVTLHMIFAQARQMRHEYVTVEHLLLGLLDNPSASDALRAVGANIDGLRRDLQQFIDTHVPRVPGEGDFDTQPTLGFQRVVQRAILSVQSAGKSDVTGAAVLVAIFGEKDSHALFLLQRHKITRLDITNYLAHGVAPERVAQQQNLRNKAGAQRNNPAASDDDDEQRPANGAAALEQFTLNLNQLAKEGKIDPLIGRDAELERVVQTLCRRRKNNPLLVGEAGVGKTAIAEGLAKRIVDGEVPEVLANATVYALDLGTLLAGTKYRGDFEQRLKNVLKALQEQEGAILFIDEIHTLIGAGAASGGNLDASNLLKPALAKGQLRCIGATTYNEYRQIFAKDHALSRRFQKIDVTEPSVADTVAILKGLKERFEAHHGVKYTAAALQAAAELSARYITDRQLPDKAIDVIDEAGAAQKVLPKGKQKKTIGKAEIEAVVAKLARIAPRAVARDDRQKLATLERDLKQVVFGQDEAIEQLVRAIKLNRAGLGNPNKPIGSFLFSGPTGVGKTEVARQLAFTLGIDLVRFDMSEYMERHTVSRLIGAPPGYVGYEEGGLLTEAVMKKPHCVLLLDEIEKAHPDVFNLLLQVMDHGTLTDANGRSTDFRHTILIMTTNAGAETMQRSAIGFTAKREAGDEMAELKRVFTPEFRNRLDAIVSFKPLTPDVIARVVDKFLLQLEAQLQEKRVEAHFTDELKAWLAAKGFDPVMGARPMARLIQETIRAALADELLFGRLAHGGEVTIDIDDHEKVVLRFPEDGETSDHLPVVEAEG
ncbi:ATP-dependent Clp protease ATP-binding subunit ClpA [Hydrogenophilus thermoluteolus]|uniref:ATP-dependent Clp protease ATP-binding subunit clpA n=1 Tax=Hydrogenophilus thermoluteolus TaxID=297 RepID=A0A2Z6DVZ2_HYDTE|nr:ATP-dependent Clp protease ATP-binding subunit ClpA [Hydrogenophilus thermoluteolus]BBD76603.1 ATP-dependent Clp protease ATP-binding subunit clpA [Hydrogenophilus thermoluteolus]